MRLQFVSSCRFGIPVSIMTAVAVSVIAFSNSYSSAALPRIAPEQVGLDGTQLERIDTVVALSLIHI